MPNNKVTVNIHGNPGTIYYSMSKLTKFGAKLLNMHGIICLDCAINIHCALNKWRLSDADGKMG